MSKTAKIVAGAASALVLAVILGAFALRDKRPNLPSPEEPDPVTEPSLFESTVASEKIPPPLPPSSVTAPTQPKPANTTKPLDETSLLSKLHDLAASDPPLSLKLAREAVARFPDSPNAPEFEWNVVKALANMDRYDEAKEEARIMVEKYPGNSFAEDVDHHLIHHPPNPQDIGNTAP
jgi:hypothetical protein